MFDQDCSIFDSVIEKGLEFLLNILDSWNDVGLDLLIQTRDRFVDVVFQMSIVELDKLFNLGLAMSSVELLKLSNLWLSVLFIRRDDELLYMWIDVFVVFWNDVGVVILLEKKAFFH